MNKENEAVYIGNCEDIDKESVENFEHEEIDYAIYNLESGFFASQGHCNCEEQAFLSEANVEGEEVECSGCGNIYSIVSGDSISNPERQPLKIFDVTIEKDSIYLNI
jgi:nitrite reductase/ring-hydroxylating ferredoxin subunit|tara:strand:+ start:746 stop:1066 length:321 start_codon:yes stop_codon:yes gene_type:complete